MSSDDQPDIMAESLRLAPEPYRSVIHRRQQEGWFGTVLNDFQKRYSLSEDQLDTVTIAAFRSACVPDDLDSMKDFLIAEADLSYEQAVKIQRDIARDVILPVKEEGDRIANAEISKPARPSEVQSSRPDKPLFHNEDLGITVTPKLLKYRAQTFPTRNMTNVAAFEGPFELKNLLINGGLAVAGVPLVLSFSGWSILGLAMVALGGFNAKDMLTKKFVVTIEMHGADDLRLQMTDKKVAIALQDALHKGMAAN